jgi:hypothetical protein
LTSSRDQLPHAVDIPVDKCHPAPAHMYAQRTCVLSRRSKQARDREIRFLVAVTVCGYSSCFRRATPTNGPSAAEGLAPVQPLPAVRGRRYRTPRRDSAIWCSPLKVAWAICTCLPRVCSPDLSTIRSSPPVRRSLILDHCSPRRLRRPEQIGPSCWQEMIKSARSRRLHTEYD